MSDILSTPVSRKQELISRLQSQDHVNVNNCLFSNYGSRKSIVLLDNIPDKYDPSRRMSRKKGMSIFHEYYRRTNPYMIVSYGK